MSFAVNSKTKHFFGIFFQCLGGGVGVVSTTEFEKTARDSIGSNQRAKETFPM